MTLVLALKLHLNLIAASSNNLMMIVASQPLAHHHMLHWHWPYLAWATDLLVQRCPRKYKRDATILYFWVEAHFTTLKSTPSKLNGFWHTYQYPFYFPWCISLYFFQYQFSHLCPILVITKGRPHGDQGYWIVYLKASILVGDTTSINSFIFFLWCK